MRADSTWARLKGLLGRDGLAPDEGLFLPACGSVHTCFMRFPIDVVFLDRAMVVRGVAAAVRPWRLAWRWGAHDVLELAAGAAAAAGLIPGQAVAMEA